MQIRTLFGPGLLSLANSQLIVPNSRHVVSVNADDDQPQCSGPCVQRLLYQTAYSSAATGLNEAMTAFESYDWCTKENALWCPDVINSTLSGIAGRAVYDATLNLDVHRCGAQCLAQSLITVTSKAAYSAMLWAKQTVNGTEIWDDSTWIRREGKIRDLEDAMWLVEREINEPKQVNGAEVAKLMNCVCYEASAAPTRRDDLNNTRAFKDTKSAHNGTRTNVADRAPRRECTCTPFVDDSQPLKSSNASSYTIPISNVSTVWNWAQSMTRSHIPISNTSTVWSWPSLVPQASSSLPASSSPRKSNSRVLPATTSVHRTDSVVIIQIVTKTAATTSYGSVASHLTETVTVTDLATTTEAETSRLAETVTESAITTVYRDGHSPSMTVSTPSPKPPKPEDKDDDDGDDDDHALALALPFLAGAATGLIPLAVKAAPCIVDPILCEARTMLPFLRGVTGVTRRVSGPFSWFGHLFHGATSIASGVTRSIVDSTTSFMSDIRSQPSHEDLPQRPLNGGWQPRDPLPPVPPARQSSGTQTDDRKTLDKGTQTVWDDVEEAREELKKAKAEVEETKIERNKARKALRDAEDRIKEAEDEAKKARKEAERAQRQKEIEKADKAKKEQEKAERGAAKVREEEAKAKKAKEKAEEKQSKAEELEKRAKGLHQEAEEKAEGERINPDDVFRGEVYDPITRKLRQETLIRTYRHIGDGMKMAELVRRGMKPYYVLGSDGTPIKSTGYEETEAASDKGFWITWKRAEDLHRMGGDWRKIGKGEHVRYVQYEDGKAALSSQGEPLVRNSLNIMDTVVASNTEKMKKYEEGIKGRMYDTDGTEVLPSPDGEPELSLESDGTVEWAGQKPEAISQPAPKPVRPNVHTVTKTSIKTSIVTVHGTQTEHVYKTVTVPQLHTTTAYISEGHDRTKTRFKTATRSLTTTAYITKTSWRSIKPVVPTETRLLTTTMYVQVTPSTKTRSTTEYITMLSTTVNTEVTTQTITASPSSPKYIMTEIHLPPRATVPPLNGICCVPAGCHNAAAPTGCHIAC